MAGIGDYIHARASGYNEHGITFDGAKKIQLEHSEFLNNIRKQRGWHDDQVLEERAKALEDIYNLKILSNNKDEIINFQNVIGELIYRQLKKDWGDIKEANMSIDENGNVKILDSESGEKYFSMGKLKDQTVSYELKQLSELLKLIYQIKEKQPTVQTATLAQRTRKQAQEDYERLKKILYVDILGNNSATNVHLKTVVDSLNKKASEISQSVKINQDNKDNNFTLEIIKEINKLVAIYAKWQPVAYIQGMSGELYVKMVPQLLSLAVQKSMKELLGMTAKNAKNVVFKKIGAEQATEINIVDAIADTLPILQKGDLRESFQTALSSGEAKANLSSTTSTSKADVVVSWEDEKGKQNMGISVKTTKVEQGKIKSIALLDGSSLLYLMSNWEVDFANTFLNVFAEHIDKSTQISENEKIEVGKHAQQTIAAQALIGYTRGKELKHQAQLFAWRNVLTGKWKVIPTMKILDRIQERIMKQNQYYTNVKSAFGLKTKFNNKDLDKVHFKNPWKGAENDIDDAYARIAQLLVDVHSHKLDVSISLTNIVDDSYFNTLT